MRLKLDENLGGRDAEWLRAQGHDVDTVADEHLTGARDEQVHAAAASANRCLLTLDLDFSDPIRFPPSQTAGTIVLRPHIPSFAMIRLLLGEAIAFAETESPAGRIWIVEAGRVRIWEQW